MHIRHFNYQHDTDSVLALMPELYQTNFPDFVIDPDFIGRKRYQLREATRDPSQTVMVAEDGQGLCGFIWLVVEHEYTGQHRGEIAAVCVSPRCRGNGVGRALMQEGEQALRLMGAETVHLMVTSANSAAVGLYHDLGYAVTRLQMEKSLRTYRKTNRQ